MKTGITAAVAAFAFACGGASSSGDDEVGVAGKVSATSGGMGGTDSTGTGGRATGKAGSGSSDAKPSGGSGSKASVGGSSGSSHAGEVGQAGEPPGVGGEAGGGEPGASGEAGMGGSPDAGTGGSGAAGSSGTGSAGTGSVSCVEEADETCAGEAVNHIVRHTSKPDTYCIKVNFLSAGKAWYDARPNECSLGEPDRTMHSAGCFVVFGPAYHENPMFFVDALYTLQDSGDACVNRISKQTYDGNPGNQFCSCP